MTRFQLCERLRRWFVAADFVKLSIAKDQNYDCSERCHWEYVMAATVQEGCTLPSLIS
jgi:hypothetical protein